MLVARGSQLQACRLWLDENRPCLAERTACVLLSSHPGAAVHGSVVKNRIYPKAASGFPCAASAAFRVPSTSRLSATNMHGILQPWWAHLDQNSTVLSRSRLCETGKVLCAWRIYQYFPYRASMRIEWVSTYKAFYNVPGQKHIAQLSV